MDDPTSISKAPALPVGPSNQTETQVQAVEPNTEPQLQSEPISQPLSKKAQKKLRKAELFAERKLERRAREKEKKKEKKREHAERVAAGEEVEDDGDARARKRAKLNHGGPRNAFEARVVVDLGFDDKMSEKEISSLCSQLAYAYSANRRADIFFSSILCTSLNGRTLARLDSMNDAGYKRWTSTEWWSESYEDLWRETLAPAEDVGVVFDGEGGLAVGQAESGTSSKKARRKGNKPGPKSTAPKDTVVYLTADSTDELNELKEGETYIIGGICDHNRYKNLCLNKATSSGIRAARLPIGRYLTNMPTRKVLTVNQVFEILLKWVETRDWEQAFYTVIPKRKFQQNGTKQAKDDEDEDEGEVCDGEIEDIEPQADADALESEAADVAAIVEPEAQAEAGVVAGVE